MGLSRQLGRFLLVLVAAAAAVLAPVATATATGTPLATVPPAVTGTPVVGDSLRAEPGVWDPVAVTYAFQWTRDGLPLAGATTSTYRPGPGDVGAPLAVVVTATDTTGAQAVATSAPTSRVARADFDRAEAPGVSGDHRYTRTLRAGPGRVGPRPESRSYRWERDGVPIDGARGAAYTLGVADVGHRVAVTMVARREGFRTVRVTSKPHLVDHLVPVRRTVTYHVETRGPTTASLAEFRRQAQETFADPRGWRAGGVRFRPVPRGGDFTLVLATAASVPGFSSGCSATWSCRVGRYVIINQLRWQTASPAWNGARRSRRDYRHMVVNHETGHWLGRGHAGCSGTGPAPVMMQQSKGTGRCSFNPWPLPSER